MWYKEQKKGECFPTTFSKGKESLFFVLLHTKILYLLFVVRRTRQKPQKISTDKKREKKRKLIPITSIESSHVVAEEKKTVVVVVVVDRLKNRLDSRRPRGGAARDVARGKRRGEYCLSSLPPLVFFGVCVPDRFSFRFFFGGFGAMR
tara:strand:- start:168 stop:611 length:444 start_codon:yes stop_codon:yes gene_type:complete